MCQKTKFLVFCIPLNRVVKQAENWYTKDRWWTFALTSKKKRQNKKGRFHNHGFSNVSTITNTIWQQKYLVAVPPKYHKNWAICYKGLKKFRVFLTDFLSIWVQKSNIFRISCFCSSTRAIIFNNTNNSSSHSTQNYYYNNKIEARSDYKWTNPHWSHETSWSPTREEWRRSLLLQLPLSFSAQTDWDGGVSVLCSQTKIGTDSFRRKTRISRIQTLIYFRANWRGSGRSGVADFYDKVRLNASS